MRRTLATYRKAVTDMQKDFFTGGQQGAPSSITMTSVGRYSALKRDVSHQDELTVAGDKADDAISTTSGMRERDLKESTSKVQQYLEANHARSHKSSSQMRSGAQAGPRTLKVNYNTVCDLERFEKFKAVVQNISTVKKLARLFSVLIKEMPGVIPCSSCCIFVVTPNLIYNRHLVEHNLIL